MDLFLIIYIQSILSVHYKCINFKLKNGKYMFYVPITALHNILFIMKVLKNLTPIYERK